MQSFSELLDKFVTVQIKLFNSLEESQYSKEMENMSKEDLLKLVKKQYSLNSQRSQLMQAIDAKLNEIIKTCGHSFDINRYKTDK